MPGFVLTMSCAVTCAHGGQAKPAAPNPRVKIMGTPVPMSAPPFMVAGGAMGVPPPAGPGAVHLGHLPSADDDDASEIDGAGAAVPDQHDWPGHYHATFAARTAY